MVDLNSNAGKLMKFFWVGVAATLVDWGMFATLHRFVGFDYILAVAVSFSCGSIVGFIFNRRWTFEVKDKALTRLFVYISVALSALFITMWLMSVFIGRWGFNALVARVFVTGIVFIYNFLMHRYLTFRKTSGGIVDEGAYRRSSVNLGRQLSPPEVLKKKRGK